MFNPRKLEHLDRGLIGAPNLNFIVSVASLWEMRLKYQSLYRSGERKNPYSRLQVLAFIKSQNFKVLELSSTHVSEILNPPSQHKDPFDELLLLQAQLETARLLTKDTKLLNHPSAISSERLASFRLLRESVRQ